jgi:competence protein ComFC
LLRDKNRPILFSNPMHTRKVHPFSVLIKNIGSGLLDFIYPPVCLVCKKPLEFEKPLFFCRTCFRNLPWIQGTGCKECGRYLAGAKHSQATCISCTESRRFFSDGVSALFFKDPVKALLFQMKYHGDFGLARPLGGLMTKAFLQSAIPPYPEWLTYVPLHPLRFKERGFNQSGLLAKEIGKRLQLKVIPALERVRFDAVQATLNMQDRIKNIRNAFTIKRNFKIKAEHVLLVDDVMTTGSTLNECAKILRENGIPRITILSLLSVED